MCLPQCCPHPSLCGLPQLVCSSFCLSALAETCLEGFPTQFSIAAPGRVPVGRPPLVVTGLWHSDPLAICPLHSPLPPAALPCAPACTSLVPFAWLAPPQLLAQHHIVYQGLPRPTAGPCGKGCCLPHHLTGVLGGPGGSVCPCSWQADVIALLPSPASLVS